MDPPDTSRHTYSQKHRKPNFHFPALSEFEEMLGMHLNKKRLGIHTRFRYLRKLRILITRKHTHLNCLTVPITKSSSLERSGLAVEKNKTKKRVADMLN